MLYREIIAVCSQIHTKHTNTQRGQNVEFVNVQLVVHRETLGFAKVNDLSDKQRSVSGDQCRSWHFLVLTQANTSKHGVMWYKRFPVNGPVLKRQQELFTGRTAKLSLQSDIYLLRHFHCGQSSCAQASPSTSAPPKHLKLTFHLPFSSTLPETFLTTLFLTSSPSAFPTLLSTL